jgi:hypothetical protein
MQLLLYFPTELEGFGKAARFDEDFLVTAIAGT